MIAYPSNCSSQEAKAKGTQVPGHSNLCMEPVSEEKCYITLSVNCLVFYSKMISDVWFYCVN